MKFSILDLPQGTDEWKQARAGRATGSRASDILATIKSGEAASRRDYRMQLIAERLTGAPQDSGFTNAEMLWGNEQEPFARIAAESAKGYMVRETGFLSLDDHFAGCSLDGDVNNFEGIIEIKCPKTATHLSYLRYGQVPDKYLPQIKHNLLVSGAQWCDFVSFDPRLPEHLQLFIGRVHAKDLALSVYEKELFKFLHEVELELKELANFKLEQSA